MPALATKVMCTEVGCEKTFTRKTDCQRHFKNVHSNERAYFCRVSGCLRKDKGFADKTKRDDHENLHDKMRPHKCTICTSAFSDRSGLAHHMKSLHPANYNPIRRRNGPIPARPITPPTHTVDPSTQSSPDVRVLLPFQQPMEMAMHPPLYVPDQPLASLMDYQLQQALTADLAPEPTTFCPANQDLFYPPAAYNLGETATQSANCFPGNYAQTADDRNITPPYSIHSVQPLYHDVTPITLGTAPYFFVFTPQVLSEDLINPEHLASIGDPFGGTINPEAPFATAAPPTLPQESVKLPIPKCLINMYTEGFRAPAQTYFVTDEDTELVWEWRPEMLLWGISVDRDFYITEDDILVQCGL